MHALSSTNKHTALPQRGRLAPCPRYEAWTKQDHSELVHFAASWESSHQECDETPWEPSRPEREETLRTPDRLCGQGSTNLGRRPRDSRGLSSCQGPCRSAACKTLLLTALRAISRDVPLSSGWRTAGSRTRSWAARSWAHVLKHVQRRLGEYRIVCSLLPQHSLSQGMPPSDRGCTPPAAVTMDPCRSTSVKPAW